MRRIKYLAIIGMLAIALAGCGKQESSKEENKVTNTPTPTAMLTFTPTPTPVQDKLIDLTEEEIEEVFEIRNSYFDLLVNEETGGIQNYYTCELVAYYKYIGLGDFELPVTVNYTEEDAEAKFGGDWTYLTDRHNGVSQKEIKTWVSGMMTVDEIEYQMLYGERDRILILSDDSLGTLSEMENLYGWSGAPLQPFSEYIRFLRILGDCYIVKQSDGTCYMLLDAHSQFE